MMNILQKYKNWTRKQYNRYYDDYQFCPNFRFNPLDDRNDWVYDNEKLRNFIRGLHSTKYAWEAWSYWMRDMKYSYKLPVAFWNELNDGWMVMGIWEKS